jgi:hypothetical protein
MKKVLSAVILIGAFAQIAFSQIQTAKVTGGEVQGVVAEGQQAEVRLPESRGADGVAADEYDLKAGLAGNSRAQSVINARHEDGIPLQCAPDDFRLGYLLLSQSSKSFAMMRSPVIPSARDDARNTMGSAIISGDNNVKGSSWFLPSNTPPVLTGPPGNRRFTIMPNFLSSAVMIFERASDPAREGP